MALETKIMEMNRSRPLQYAFPVNNFGLYTGKTGLCLSYFMHADVTKNKEDKKKAKKLLNEIGANISNVEDFSFENGLLGIGWAIEWIAQQKFMKIDTNEVLSDLDDEIYKLIMYSKAKDISLNQGILGRILYLYKRVSTSNSQMDFYRETSLVEVLILAIDELYETLNGTYTKHSLIEANESMRLILGQSLLMLIKLKPLKLSSLVDDLLKQFTNMFETFIKDLERIENVKSYQTSLNCFFNAGVELNNKVWTNEIDYILSTKNLSHKQFINNNKYFYKREPILHKLISLSKLNNNYSWQEGWLIR